MTMNEQGVQPPGAPPSGRIREGVHTFAARVYYEDTDAGGVVYHTSYLRLAERARTELMRCAGFDHGLLLERYNVLFALRRCLVEFARPARLDESLEVRTRVTRVAGASFDGRQTIVRDEGVLVELDCTLACLAPVGRPVRLPREDRAALEKLCLNKG